MYRQHALKYRYCTFSTKLNTFMKHNIVRACRYLLLYFQHYKCFFSLSMHFLGNVSNAIQCKFSMHLLSIQGISFNAFALMYRQHALKYRYCTFSTKLNTFMKLNIIHACRYLLLYF